MLLTPTLIIEDITTLDVGFLADTGIKGLILDLDNTIMAPRTGILEEPVKHWLQQMNDSGIRCICVTNNKRQEYFLAAEKTINMPVIGHARKPFKRKLLEALNLLELPAHEVAVVGDRPLTDILGGAWIGSHTILVDPLTKMTEPPIIKLLRKLERCCVRVRRSP